MTSLLLRPTDRGLYCEAGDFFVDPWTAVDRAVITHAHGDHLTWGCRRYLTAEPGVPLVRERLEEGAVVQGIPYGESVQLNGVRVSLHPAGHILGSAQVRLELGGEVWVVSGDYKTDPDPTCMAFEPLRCHGFVTESTFGLPIYRWPRQNQIFADINDWWRANQGAGKASLLLGYGLGKAQRLLAGLDPSLGSIFTHGTVERFTEVYRAAGVTLPPTSYVGTAEPGTDWSRAMIIAPPAADATTWARRFGPRSIAFASGWMAVRGARRRRGVDRGFPLSDHADWSGLQAAIEATGAEQVWVTHGYSDVMERWLRDRGMEARTVATRFEGERDDG